MAFEIYRNYDGAGLNVRRHVRCASTSANQGKLSVYGALRTQTAMVTSL